MSARTLAAEADAAKASRTLDAILDKLGARDTGTGGQTVEAGNARIMHDGMRRLERAIADAARWRKVAPLIDELSNARGLHRVHDIADQIAATTQEPEIEAAIENDRRGLADSLASLRTVITSALAAAREAGRREVLEGAAGVETSLLKLAAVAYSQGTHAVRARIGEDGADRDHLRASGDLIVAEQSLRAAIAADKARAVEAASDAAFDRGRAATIKYADGFGLRPVLSREDAEWLVNAHSAESHGVPSVPEPTWPARAALLAALTGAGGGS